MRWGRFLATVATVLAGVVAGDLTSQTLAPDLLNGAEVGSLPDSITVRVTGSGGVRGGISACSTQGATGQC
jgi:hypothetical protein